MLTWAILHFALALTVVIGILALIISETHMAERAEEQELWKQIEELKKKLAKVG